MARDRFSDDYEDDDRPARRDRRDDDLDDGPRRRRGGSTAAAAAKVGTPGMLLTVTGVVSLLIALLSLAVSVAKPSLLSDPVYDYFITEIKKLPQNANTADQIAKLEQAKVDGQKVNPLNVAGGALSAALSAVIVFGALKMRSLTGYGLALTGSILAIQPIQGCCCLTLPFGIWALVVLVNADVKSAFGLRRSGPSLES